VRAAVRYRRPLSFDQVFCGLIESQSETGPPIRDSNGTVVKLAWAFLKRDALIALSYRVDFAFQILGRLVLIVIFYFIVRSFGVIKAPAGFGGGLFPYILVGIAFADCISVSMTIFAKQIREGTGDRFSGSDAAGAGTPLRYSALLVAVGLRIQRGAVSFLSRGGRAVSRGRFFTRKPGKRPGRPVAYGFVLYGRRRFDGKRRLSLFKRGDTLPLCLAI